VGDTSIEECRKRRYSFYREGETMKFDPSIHHRRSIRLANFDYSQQGANFVTICTHNRINLFGEVIAGDMKLNSMGKIVLEELEKSEIIR
jgi:putative transposase